MKPRPARARRGFTGSSSSAGVLIIGACVLLGVSTGVLRQPRDDEALREALPGPATREGYVTSSACQACHPAQYETWHRSYHRTMTQVATPVTALAPFDGRVLESRGFRWSFERRGAELWVQMPDPLWFEQPSWLMRALDETWPERPPTIEARIVMSTGSHHMQTYWIRRPDGAALGPDDGSLIQVPWVWLIDEGRWVPNEDSFLTPPTESVGGVARWNANCSQCHSVATEPGATATSERFDTRTVELGIACEACHGPAQRHVEHYRSPLRRYLHYLRSGRGDDPPDPTIVNPAKLEPRRSNDVCGQCHSFGSWRDTEAYLKAGSAFVPGDVLEDHREIDRHDPDRPMSADGAPGDGVMETRFWPDGTSRVAGRESSAILASTHYRDSEITCLSCHSLHDYEAVDTQLLPGADGNAACVGCHQEYEDRAAEHSRHASGSSGSECMSCHMPRTTYGLFTAMRSHRIDSPDLASSIATGRPNACNLCHLDRTLEWTGRYLQEWYAAPPVELDLEGRTVAAAALWTLRGDAGLRTITGWHMGWGPARDAAGEDWAPPFLAQLLTDPYSATRRVAYRSLIELPGFEDFQYDYLSAPTVRAAAADEVMGRWRALGAPSVARPETLVLEGGALDRPGWLYLLAQRDSTPVRIRE